MREVAMNPGDTARLWVDDTPGGKRVFLRLGNGRVRELRPAVADQLGGLLMRAADECRAVRVTADERPPAAARPSEADGQLGAYRIVSQCGVCGNTLTGEAESHAADCVFRP